MPIEASVLDCPIGGSLDRDLDVVAAQWIIISKQNIVRIKLVR